MLPHVDVAIGELHPHPDATSIIVPSATLVSNRGNEFDRTTPFLGALPTSIGRPAVLRIAQGSPPEQFHGSTGTAEDPSIMGLRSRLRREFSVACCSRVGHCGDSLLGHHGDSLLDVLERA